MIGTFRHKGLEEVFARGTSRRIGAEYLRKCVRILQLLESATLPEDLNIAGLRFHGLQGQPATLGGQRKWQSPDHLWVARCEALDIDLDIDFEDYH